MSKKIRTKEMWRRKGLYMLACYLLFFLPEAVLAQQTNVRGIVRDAQTQETLSGVTVIVDGVSVTSTDDNGVFQLTNVGREKSLTFSYLGYVTHSQLASPSMNVSLVSMEADALEEVVVVGYGTQRKETLTGSVTQIDAQIFEDRGALSSPLQALQGQVPGVMITRSSGAPGDESWGMRVRGAVSAKTAEPLVIIDGVAYDSFRELRLLNPSDIESMSFLKDAAAAIYGSRAAGGVMLVTTKKGKSGKGRVELNSLYGYKKPGLQPRLMSLQEWADGVIVARTNDGFGESDPWIRYANLALANQGGFIDTRDANNAPIGGAFGDVADFVFMDNNWTDVLWGGAGSTQNDLNISGGSEKGSYRLSLGYLHDQGTLQWGNNNNNRYNARLNNVFHVSDRFTIESVVSFSYQNQVMPSMVGRTLGQGYPQPGLPVSTIDGKPYAWGGQYTPHWFSELGGDNNLKVKSTNISETFKFKVTDKLQWVTNLGFNTSHASRDVQERSIEWFNYRGDLLGQINPTQANSFYGKSTAATDFYSGSTFLQYTDSFKDLHNISLTAGGQYEFNDYDRYEVRITDINSSLSGLNGSGVITTPDTRREQFALGSYFSRFNYDYNAKYLFEANARYDGSSKFARENRWNLFYGVSAGWRIAEESFVKDLGIFNELKLRASYGAVGNQAGIDIYDGAQLYNQNTASGAYLGANRVSFVRANTRLVSYDRTWERIHNYNIALDFALLQNRLSGTLERFVKKNNNMFLSQQYPAVLGATAPEANIGTFKGNGWELSANWSDTKGDFGYSLGGVFTFVENELVDFGGVNLINSGGIKGAVQGFPLNSVVGLMYDGRIQNEEQRQAYLAAYQIGNTIGLTDQIRVGDNMYRDMNGDGLLTYDDLVYLGTDDPKVQYSFHAGANYKGFDFNVIFQGAAERTIFRGDVNWRQPFRSVYLNTTNQSVNNHWTESNPEAHFPKYSTNGSINAYNYQASSWAVENGAYLRLKNIVLGYSLPSYVLDRVKGLSRFRVYVAAQDLWETTKINDSWDPEATSAVSSGIQRYPFNRSFTFGINASF